MHVQQPPRPGAPVQVVHVLRDQKERARPAAVEFRERAMRGVGLHGRIGELGAARVVEFLHARRIAPEGLRRRHILDAHALPDAVRVAEGGKPAFARNARPCQDNYAGRGVLVARRPRHRPDDPRGRGAGNGARPSAGNAGSSRRGTGKRIGMAAGT